MEKTEDLGAALPGAAMASRHWPREGLTFEEGKLDLGELEIELKNLDGPGAAKPAARQVWFRRMQARWKHQEQQQERSMQLAWQAFRAYSNTDSKDISHIDSAFNHYMATGRRLQRKNWGLLQGCAVIALRRFLQNGKTPEDLGRLVRIGNEEVALWPQRVNPRAHGGNVALMIGFGYVVVWERSLKWEESPTPEGNTAAFDLARKCLLKAIHECAAGTSTVVQAQAILGVIVVERWEYNKKGPGWKNGIHLLERAHQNIDKLDKSVSTDYRYHIAKSLSAAYFQSMCHQSDQRTFLLLWKWSVPKIILSVNKCLEYMEEMWTEREKLKGPDRRGQPALVLIHGGLYMQRWIVYKNRDDGVKAKQIMQALRDIGWLPEGLQQQIGDWIKDIDAECSESLATP